MANDPTYGGGKNPPASDYGGGKTPAGSNTSTMEPRDNSDLLSSAQSQVAAEIQGQIGPLQAEQGSLVSGQRNALQEIGRMFGQINPIVQGEADKVAASYKEAMGAESGIFSEAFKRLNDLKGARAAEAQRLAQEMGGPVAVGEFTDSVDTQLNVFPHQAAGDLLHALGNAQAGEQESRAFAGKVFPALRTEQEAKARYYYQDQIKTIKKEIASIKATKTGETNKRYNEMLTKEREFKLAQAQNSLAKLNAKRDWLTSQAQLKQEQQRIDLAKDQLDADKSHTDWTERHTDLVDMRNYMLANKELTQKAGESAADFAERKRQFDLSWKQNEATRKLSIQQNTQSLKVSAGNLLQAYAHPTQKTESVSFTRTVNMGTKLPRTTKGTYWIGKNGHYYTTVKETKVIPTSSTAVTDPRALYKLLTAAGIPKEIATAQIRNYLGNQQWTWHAKPLQKKGGK